MAVEAAAAWLATLEPGPKARGVAALRALLHDFNNPLGALGMDLFVIRHGLQGAEPGAEVSAALAGVDRSLDELTELFRELERVLNAEDPQ